MFRFAAVPLVAAALVLLFAAQASAAGVGIAQSTTETASTVSWSATLARSDGTLLTGGTLPAGTGATVFGSVRNTGTIALASQTYQLSGAVLPTAKVDACVGGTWNTTANTCGGTVQSLLAFGSSSASVSLPLAVGASVGIRISTLLPASLNVSVARSDVRAATTSNS